MYGIEELHLHRVDYSIDAEIYFPLLASDHFIKLNTLKDEGNGYNFRVNKYMHMYSTYWTLLFRFNFLCILYATKAIINTTTDKTTDIITIGIVTELLEPELPAVTEWLMSACGTVHDQPLCLHNTSSSPLHVPSNKHILWSLPTSS